MSYWYRLYINNTKSVQFRDCDTYTYLDPKILIFNSNGTIVPNNYCYDGNNCGDCINNGCTGSASWCLLKENFIIYSMESDYYYIQISHGESGSSSGDLYTLNIDCFSWPPLNVIDINNNSLCFDNDYILNDTLSTTVLYRLYLDEIQSILFGTCGSEMNTKMFI